MVTFQVSLAVIFGHVEGLNYEKANTKRERRKRRTWVPGAITGTLDQVCDHLDLTVICPNKFFLLFQPFLPGAEAPVRGSGHC